MRKTTKIKKTQAQALAHARTVKIDVYFVTDKIPFRETFVTLEADDREVDRYVPEGAAAWDEIEECEWKHQLDLAAFGLLKKNDHLPTLNHWHILTVEICDAID